MRTRSSIAVALSAAALAVAASPAQAETPGQRAEAHNRAGKAKITELDLEGAAQSFRAAIAIVPDPRYYYNLCYTLDRAGKNEEARA